MVDWKIQGCYVVLGCLMSRSIRSSFITFPRVSSQGEIIREDEERAGCDKETWAFAIVAVITRR